VLSNGFTDYLPPPNSRIVRYVRKPRRDLAHATDLFFWFLLVALLIILAPLTASVADQQFRMEQQGFWDETFSWRGGYLEA